MRTPHGLPTRYFGNQLEPHVYDLCDILHACKQRRSLLFNELLNSLSSKYSDAKLYFLNIPYSDLRRINNPQPSDSARHQTKSESSYTTQSSLVHIRGQTNPSLGQRPFLLTLLFLRSIHRLSSAQALAHPFRTAFFHQLLVPQPFFLHESAPSTPCYLPNGRRRILRGLLPMLLSWALRTGAHS